MYALHAGTKLGDKGYCGWLPTSDSKWNEHKLEKTQCNQEGSPCSCAAHSRGPGCLLCSVSYRFLDSLRTTWWSYFLPFSWLLSKSRDCLRMSPASLLSCPTSNQLSTQQRMPSGLLKAARRCSLEATASLYSMEGDKENVMAKPRAYKMTPLRSPLCQSDPGNNRALPFKSSGDMTDRST